MCSKSPASGSCRRSPWAAAALVISLMVIGGVQQAWAHVDPGASSGSGIGIAITAYRFDQVTPVLPGTVTECEKIWYQASLFKQPAPNAAFEGGTWTLTTPDGVVHPLGAVPCIGGTVNDPNLPGGRGGTCSASPSSLTSGFVLYTVRAVDPAMFLATSAISGSFAHLSANDQGGGFASFGITLEKDPACNDGIFCNGMETCDSSIVFGEFGERMGTCVGGTAPCVDNLFCGDVACNEATDQCDVTDTSATVCPDDALFCNDQTCNETTNQCDVNPPAVDPCPDDALFCNDQTCNEATNQCDVNPPAVDPCSDDALFCGDQTCNETTNICDVNPPAVDPCPDDALFCNDQTCNEATNQCDVNPPAIDPCPDGDLFCGDQNCNETTNQCDVIPPAVDPCPDGALFCNDQTCNETTNQCDVNPPAIDPCPDNEFCANVTCSEASDMCITTDVSTTVCPDNEFCANTVCNEASDACDRTDISDQQCPDDPGNVCEDNTCVEAEDGCLAVPADPLPAECVGAICRTPGFWSSHAYANPDKQGSRNIAQEVINAGGGCLEVCGEVITNTDKNNADSVIEAMCVSVKGISRLQLVRQLTAAALNCVVSGGGSDCAGAPLYASVFSTCNAVCADPAGDSGLVAACIDEVDCLNNGGLPMGNGFCQLGTCAGNGLPCENSCTDGSACLPLPGNCHDQPLVNEDLGLDFDPPGPAGSEKRCNSAKENECKVIQPKENACGAGTKIVAPEMCP